MTSLALQLKRLALPQSDPNLLSRKDVASLLFDPKDAATMDRSTFYALGCTGLEELLGIEPAFLEFHDTLFSPASMTLERSVQSKEVNEKLDAGISLFLTRLCPYFLLKPAHKCIEWLVHRFHVQLYNPDSLLACALPYHDTNLFVRVVQLLNLKEATNRWNWLRCLQKPGVPLSRGTLITHCYSDLSFMDFICTLVTRSIQAYSGHSESFSQLRVIFSFYACAIVPALDAVDKISDAIIAKLLPYVQMGLKSSLSDYKAATYMIVCQLAVKVVMEASLVDSLAVHVSKSLRKEPVLAKEGLGCLIVLLQNQKEGSVGPRALKSLCSMPALVSTLQVMAASHDVGPLLGYMLPQLVRGLFCCSSDERGADRLNLLESILKSVPLTKDLDRTVARLLLEEYLNQTERSADDMSSLDQRLLPVVRLFESRYCQALDAVLAGHVSDSGDPQQKHLFHQFLTLSVSSGKFQILDDLDTSLLLSLKHPQPSVRVAAVDHLMSIVTSEQRQSLDETFLRDAVAERLNDDVPEVVTAALGVLQMLLDVLDPEDVVSWLLSLLQRLHPPVQQWMPVLTEAVRLLSDPRLGKGDAEFLQKTGWKLLPFLVITSSEVGIAHSIARSSIFSQHPLTLSWAQELQNVTKKRAQPDFVGMANQRLVATLTKNLTSMEHFSKRDALEKLVLLVEQQRGAGLSGRASFLVLTQTLLLSLGVLSETQHLLTAQRVYTLLEPPLLDVIRNDDGQEVRCPVPVPPTFSEALGVYLSRCEQQPGQRLDQEFGSVLIALLRDFISSLRCHDSSFKGEAWWNPEKMDANTCCYLGLICRLFSIIIGGAAEGPVAGSCRALMKQLVQVHLQEPTILFRFLCLIWGYSSNHGDQLDVKVDAILQTRALHMGRVLMEVQPAATLNELAAPDSPVVLSLVCCLSSPVQEVRRAALCTLQSLSGASSSPFHPIIERLQKTSEEIITDASYLSTVLGVLHDESLSGKAKSQQGKLQVAQQLLTSRCPAYTAATLLEALSSVNGKSVLSALLPLLEHLLAQTGPDTPSLLQSETQLLRLMLGKFNEASAPLLAEDENCMDLFVRALTVDSCQIFALEQITKPFFSALGDEKAQQKLLSVMFDLLAEGCSALVANTVGSVFKAIAVDAQLVANELAPPDKPKVSVTVQQTRRSRMTQRKPQESDSVCPDGGAVSWQRVTLILELLQHKKKLKRAQVLVPALFSLLSRSLEPSAADQTNMEYTKQMLLSCLLNVCTRLSADGGPPAADILDEEKFSVELVVQVIRSSDMPQTHHHALLLLSATAAIFPEKVLHNIMPIFTFMGANVLRLDDAYSFRVIEKTMQTVVPALVRAHRLSDGSSAPVMVAVVTRIMHVFADALPHVPEHRRLPVLGQLLTALGPAHFLWILMLLLLKLHATQSGGAGDKDAALESDMDFWVSLCCQFEANQQLSSLINILNFLLQLPDDKDEAAAKPAVRRRAAKKKKDEPEEKTEDLIFNVEAHSGKELRHFKFLCVSFIAQLLGSSSFIQKVSEESDNSKDSLQQLQQTLLEKILRYIHSVAHCVEDNTDQPTAKFWRVLLNKTYEVLDKVNALLPTDTFITVMKGLMGNELPSVRRKAMELLNNKLHHRTQWDEQQVASLLQLTSDLLSIVGKSPGKSSEEAEQAINRQTALYSLKLLCRTFGSAHKNVFVPVLLQAVDIVTATAEDKNVTGSALLCIAEVVGAVKTLAIAQLPRLMPAVLHALSDRKELLTNEIYLLSAVTALQRVTETLVHFISPYLQDIMFQVCRLTRLTESSSSSTSSSSSSPHSQLCLRLSSLRNTLAANLPPRVLLPTISRCYSCMVEDRKSQLAALMSILQEHIGHIEQEQLSAHQSELTTFFLTSLDFRAEHCQGDLEKAWQVEGGVIDCLIAMVMKLSEVTFRPLFFKLFDWTKSNSKDRLLTFYRLCDRIAERLKGLFVLFAGNLVKPLADVLKQTNSAKTDELIFDSDRSEEKNCLLLRLVLDVLQKISLYDTHRFLSRERADALLGPLVDQLENSLGGTQVYQNRVVQHLAPCVGQFAVALADDSQWKTLNYQILLKTRHSDSKVRFSSLLMLMELASRLKENYVVLLPETIPFLAELMEDECEEVEQQVQKVIQEMENILGEPLQSYF
ncbi:HEAT repeat-containing protein 1 [Gambusia affinis]|uniref:HEAT repeat-containing protein 1 n=1 Tax=Gambusia affinis TaxID=33528 RepID=UPI001CDC241E|nr:HEAT repeat-containing protein 1 [Gambusia affinis]XP_043958199.1 HEAT repeat-containing protein 1 [Gambusia affinis]XP_043958200.1 HEAT repeat-containing protein 1 [Gambusia affinis]